MSALHQGKRPGRQRRLEQLLPQTAANAASVQQNEAGGGAATDLVDKVLDAIKDSGELRSHICGCCFCAVDAECRGVVAEVVL